jgi:hypothetical protein
MSDLSSCPPLKLQVLVAYDLLLLQYGTYKNLLWQS